QALITLTENNEQRRIDLTNQFVKNGAAEGSTVISWESEGGSPEAPHTIEANDQAEVELDGQRFTLTDGHVVIAAITSCTNTSNPDVMVAAGLVAKKARELGLDRKPWVKSSLAPGSQVVTAYLEASGLLDDLE